MEEKEWVKEHIKKLTNNSKSEELLKLFDEKMNLINKPFYKYCSFPQNDSEPKWNVENLKNNLLFFQNPENFNDPFDCFLGFSINEIIKDAIVKKLKSKKQYNANTKLFIEELFGSNKLNITSEDEITESIFKQFIAQILKQEMKDEENSELFSNVLNLLFMQDDNGRKLLVKFINNQLTIKDKKDILISLYKIEDFRNFIKNDKKHVDIVYHM